MTLTAKGLSDAARRRAAPSLASPRSTRTGARRSAASSSACCCRARGSDARWFPNEVFTRMAELGYLGLKYPEEHGGEGGDYVHEAVLT